MCSEPEDPGGVGSAEERVRKQSYCAYGIYRTHVRRDEVRISEDRVCAMMFVVAARGNRR